MNRFIRNKSFNFSISVVIGAMTLGLLTSVKAQINPNPEQVPTPKFTSAENANKLKLPVKLPTDGKSFKPNGLNQINKIPKTRGIIGEDNRIPMTLRKYPWSAIGRVAGITASGGEYHCTGTLISENVVLTNSHCVFDR